MAREKRHRDAGGRRPGAARPHAQGQEAVERGLEASDPGDAKIARMKDGSTHLAYKPEHAVDLDTGVIVAAPVSTSPTPTTPGRRPARWRQRRRASPVAGTTLRSTIALDKITSVEMLSREHELTEKQERVVEVLLEIRARPQTSSAPPTVEGNTRQTALGQWIWECDTPTCGWRRW
jgi:hypothetical protein